MAASKLFARGEYNGVPVVTFQNDDNDRFPFTFGPVKARKLCDAMNTLGEAVVLAALAALAGGETPKFPKNKNMNNAEYNGHKLLAFTDPTGKDKRAFQFGKSNAGKVLAGLKADASNIAYLYKIAGVDRLVKGTAAKGQERPSPAPKTTGAAGKAPRKTASTVASPKVKSAAARTSKTKGAK